MQLNIVVDTREQKPYQFKKYDCTCEVKTLKTGDYSISGLENEIAIERKSKSDLFGSLGSGRKRFEREFQRLQVIKYPVLLVESSLYDLFKPIIFSKMKPIAVVNSVISWSIKYSVHVFFGCNRELSESLAYRILEKYYSNKQKGVI
jgi:DNA excision repair protein ERCC-4